MHRSPSQRDSLLPTQGQRFPLDTWKHDWQMAWPYASLWSDLVSLFPQAQEVDEDFEREFAALTMQNPSSAVRATSHHAPEVSQLGWPPPQIAGVVLWGMVLLCLPVKTRTNHQNESMVS